MLWEWQRGYWGEVDLGHGGLKVYTYVHNTLTVQDGVTGQERVERKGAGTVGCRTPLLLVLGPSIVRDRPV